MLRDIAVDARSDIMSQFRSSADSVLTIPVKNKEARMNFFTLGLKFGLIYYF